MYGNVGSSCTLMVQLSGVKLGQFSVLPFHSTGFHNWPQLVDICSSSSSCVHPFSLPGAEQLLPICSYCGYQRQCKILTWRMQLLPTTVYYLHSIHRDFVTWVKRNEKDMNKMTTCTSMRGAVRKCFWDTNEKCHSVRRLSAFWSIVGLEIEFPWHHPGQSS